MRRSWERRSEKALQKLRLDNYDELRKNEYHKGHSYVDEDNALLQALRDKDLEKTYSALTEDYYEARKREGLL